ncbi:MAG: SLBB domain-containing protein [Thermodesulfobacteriota bacterium]|nr:SLBB domain-containing protein [Thermodesulfobacteriota bacterium]
MPLKKTLVLGLLPLIWAALLSASASAREPSIPDQHAQTQQEQSFSQADPSLAGHGTVPAENIRQISKNSPQDPRETGPGIPARARPQNHGKASALFNATAHASAFSPPPSPVEALYREKYASPSAGALTQFGYEIFSSPPARPPGLAAPGPDYTLGPGDTVKVRVWGADQDWESRGVVAPDGTLDIPRVGIVPVASLSLEKARAVIFQETQKYFQGINLDVSLAKLRSMEIYVVGEVERPGPHAVPGAATVLPGLIAAGGVKKTGSLRHIRVSRNDKPLCTLDLYELLLSGSRRSDVSLRDGDVIFVPRIGPTAAVAGAVAHPGIYELKNEQSVADLIGLAGGELPQGFSGRTYLRRYENDDFVVLDLSGERGQDRTALKNGDLLEVRFVDPERPEVVRLTGHVNRPDVFRHRPGLTLSDVLPGPEILKPEAITDFALLHRYDQTTTRMTVQTFPLGRVFRKQFNAELRPFDTIQVLSRTRFRIKEPLQLSGAVWSEGEFAFTPGLKLVDLLAMGGGLKFGADTGRIEISRKILENGEVDTEHLLVDFKDQPGFELKPYDYVFVPQAREATLFKTASIKGEVRFPGTYRLRKGEHLSDLIERAGGFTQDAYFHGAGFTSLKARAIQQENIDRLVREMELRSAQILSGQTGEDMDKEDAETAKAAGFVGGFKA